MNKTLLITRPKYDITVHYLFYWSKKIIELAKEKGIKVLNLEGKRANCKEVESMLRKIEPSLVFLNGHGNDDRITGHDNEVLLVTGRNEGLLVSKIVYALSCRSGKKLGCESVKKGTLGYIGYDDDFIFIIDPDKISDPLKDKTAELFLEASNQVMICLIKGHDIKYSHEQSKKIFLNNARKLVNSESEQSYLIPYLLWNMQHQVCLGDENASFKGD